MIKDRDARLAYQREWYQRNKERHKANTSARRNRARKELRAEVQELKGSTPCKDCGIQYPFYVMHFDHLGNKDRAISSAIQGNWSRSRVFAEMAKCDLVCANCHAERTWQRASSSGGRAPV